MFPGDGDNALDAMEALESFDFFFTMSAEEMEALLPLFKRVNVPAGQTVIEVGAQGDGLFLIADGQARVHHGLAVKPHEEKTLAILRQGEFFGETNLVEDTPNPHSVTTMSRMTLYHLTRKAFLEFLKKKPAIVLNLMKTLFQRESEGLRRTNLELALQYEVGRIISQALPLQQMVARLLKQMVISLEVNAAAMLYENPATGLFEVLGTEGEDAKKTRAINFHRSLPGVEALRRAGQPVVFAPVDTGSAPIVGLERHHLLLCPLLEDDTMKGFIVLMDRKNGNAFSQFQQTVMDDLGHVLSSTIAIARQRDMDRAKERLAQKRFR